MSKQELDETVLVAVRRLLAGVLHLSETMGRIAIRKFASGAAPEQDANLERLTDRELEVFKLIGRGKKNAEIAKDLSLSVKTIESQRERIKGVLELSSGVDLVRCAILWIESGRIS